MGNRILHSTCGLEQNARSFCVDKIVLIVSCLRFKLSTYLEIKPNLNFDLIFGLLACQGLTIFWYTWIYPFLENLRRFRFQTFIINSTLSCFNKSVSVYPNPQCTEMVSSINMAISCDDKNNHKMQWPEENNWFLFSMEWPVRAIMIV